MENVEETKSRMRGGTQVEEQQQKEQEEETNMSKCMRRRKRRRRMNDKKEKDNHRRRSRGTMRMKIMMTGCGGRQTERENRKEGEREQMMEI